MLSPLMFAAAALAGVPDLPPPASSSGEEIRKPAPEEGKGGPYEPVEEVNVVVEARAAEAPRPITIAPYPRLERRYAPREREPVNRIRIPF